MIPTGENDGARTVKCPNTPGCPLFPLFRMKSSLGVWQNHYCENAYETCVRYAMSRTGERVPPNLLPNGRELDLPPAPT
jgi:hypothetical protein